MANPPGGPRADQRSAEDAHVDPGPTTGPPRWVKVSAVVALVAVVLVVVLLLSGGGHGPGRHTGPGGDDTSPLNVTESDGSAGHNAPQTGHAP